MDEALPTGDQPPAKKSWVKIPKPEGYEAPSHVAGRPVCGAWARQRGGPCLKAPGFGTEHVGQGKCVYHGGKTPTIHGRYSTIVKDEFAKALEHVQQSGDPLDIQPELAFLRAVLVRWISQHASELASSQEADLGKIRVATDLIDQIGKTIGRIERIRALSALGLPEVRELVRKMAVVVERVVDDPVKLASIAGEWHLLGQEVLGKQAESSSISRALVAASEED